MTRKWCRLDPSYTLKKTGGAGRARGMATVMTDAELIGKATQPMKFRISHPPGWEGEVNGTDPGLGQGEEVEFLENANLTTNAQGNPECIVKMTNPGVPVDSTYTNSEGNTEKMGDAPARMLVEACGSTWDTCLTWDVSASDAPRAKSAQGKLRDNLTVRMRMLTGT